MYKLNLKSLNNVVPVTYLGIEIHFHCMKFVSSVFSSVNQMVSSQINSVV